jgi:NADP-dependent 3-hydroxy acid dehydrogenase YdfG
MREVLVTAASGGIGASVASVLASSGHRVIAVGRDSDRLERLSSDGARLITAADCQMRKAGARYVTIEARRSRGCRRPT